MAKAKAKGIGRVRASRTTTEAVDGDRDATPPIDQEPVRRGCQCHRLYVSDYDEKIITLLDFEAVRPKGARGSAPKEMLLYIRGKLSHNDARAYRSHPLLRCDSSLDFGELSPLTDPTITASYGQGAPEPFPNEDKDNRCMWHKLDHFTDSTWYFLPKGCWTHRKCLENDADPDDLRGTLFRLEYLPGRGGTTRARYDIVPVDPMAEVVRISAEGRVLGRVNRGEYEWCGEIPLLPREIRFVPTVKGIVKAEVGIEEKKSEEVREEHAAEPSARAARASARLQREEGGADKSESKRKRARKAVF